MRGIEFTGWASNTASRKRSDASSTRAKQELLFVAAYEAPVEWSCPQADQTCSTATTPGAALSAPAIAALTE